MGECAEKFKFFGSMQELRLPKGIDGVLGIKHPYGKEEGHKYSVGSNFSFSLHH